MTWYFVVTTNKTQVIFESGVFKYVGVCARRQTASLAASAAAAASLAAANGGRGGGRGGGGGCRGARGLRLHSASTASAPAAPPPTPHHHHETDTSPTSPDPPTDTCRLVAYTVRMGTALESWLGSWLRKRDVVWRKSGNFFLNLF